MVGCVEDAMGLTLACLKNLASLDDDGGLGFACTDGNGPTHHVERVADVAVKVPRHLFPRREDQMTSWMPNSTTGRLQRAEAPQLKRLVRFRTT